jgi:fucose permease
LGSSRLGIALGGLALGALASMPGTGLFIRHYGSRTATALAVALTAVAIATVTLAPSLLLLCVGTAALGAGSGALDIATNAHGLNLEGRYDRPILSSFHAVFSAGGLIGSICGAAAALALIDQRAHLALVGLVVLLVGLVATRRFADPRPRTPRVVKRRATSPPRRLWTLGLLAFVCMLIEGSAADWSGVYLRRNLGTSAGFAALGFASFSVTTILGRAVGDRLVTRFGPPRVVAVGASVGALGFGTALTVAAPGAALAGYACVGGGIAGIVPVLFRAASTTPGISTDAALSAVTSMGYVGFLAGPSIIGGLGAAIGLPSALSLTVVLGFVVAVLAPTLRPVADRPACADPLLRT